MAEEILAGLNPEQIEAVTHNRGPLLIIAGAGTGKTTVITRRIAWLLSRGLAKTDEILALTFTDKAAGEMLERVDILLPYGYTDIWISTFHAFGDKLLRENALVAGLNPDFKVLTQSEAAVFFREHLFEFNLAYYRPLSDPTRFIEALLSLFSRAKDEDISPQDYLNYAREFLIKAKQAPQDSALNEEALQQLEVANSYAKYQELLAGAGLVDFGNQFYWALKLLREHPLILKSYQQQFKYILVDEFQDTNYAQYQLVKLLAQKSGNITVTGDDDQCIYRFRGAAYSNLLNFIQDFPQAKKISLIRNYRSGQLILDSAYKLIQQNNPERFEVKANINKRLAGSGQGRQGPVHRHFDSHGAEADWVATTIKEKVKSGDYTWKDFAILVRSNSDARAYLQAMNMQDIPWQFSGSQGLYTREEVKICLNFLRVIASVEDSLSLYYLSSSEIYLLPPLDLSLCLYYARRRNKSLYAVFKNLKTIPELSEVTGDSVQKIEKILADLNKFLSYSRQQSSGRLLYSFLTQTGYLNRLTQDQNLENETKIQNIARFFNLVQEFELVAKETRVVNFINYLDLLIEAGDDPPTVERDPDTDAVSVLTIHKAKGLEFRVVFMVSLVGGRFPWPRRRHLVELPDVLIKEILPSGNFHLQEERRLFYVGMTRTKEALYFTSADDYGGQRLRQVSQFVVEALGKEDASKQKKRTTALEAIRRFGLEPETKIIKTTKIPETKLLRLSFYHLDDYLSCPLKYKYVHILRLPILEHHTVIYGRAMHEAVTKYFQFKLAHQSMELAELLDAFRNSFEPQGFLAKEHAEERRRIGEEALIRFFEREQKCNHRPLYIEKEFSFILNNNKITGRFDRIDQEEDGVVIIDFKTSGIKKQQEADKKTKESLQLALYNLAYKNIFGQLPKRSELHFLESGLIGTAQMQEGSLKKVEEKISEVSSGIRAGNFAAAPTYMACNYCAYNQICPQS